MESTRAMKTGGGHLFSKYLDCVGRNKPFYKVFGNIYCGFNSDSAHNEALKSFKVAAVVLLVADSVQSRTSLTTLQNTWAFYTQQ